MGLKVRDGVLRHLPGSGVRGCRGDFLDLWVDPEWDNPSTASVLRLVKKSRKRPGLRPPSPLPGEWTLVFKTFFKTNKQNNFFLQNKTDGGAVEAGWGGGGQGSSAGAGTGRRWKCWG